MYVSAGQFCCIQLDITCSVLQTFFPQLSFDFGFVHLCCCSVAKSYLPLCDPKNCGMPATLSFTVSRSLLKLMSIELMMPSNHLIFCHPLLLLLSIFPSIRVFSKNELALHKTNILIKSSQWKCGG